MAKMVAPSFPCVSANMWIFFRYLRYCVKSCLNIQQQNVKYKFIYCTMYLFLLGTGSNSWCALYMGRRTFRVSKGNFSGAYYTWVCIIIGKLRYLPNCHILGVPTFSITYQTPFFQLSAHTQLYAVHVCKYSPLSVVLAQFLFVPNIVLLSLVLAQFLFVPLDVTYPILLCFPLWLVLKWINFSCHIVASFDQPASINSRFPLLGHYVTHNTTKFQSDEKPSQKYFDKQTAYKAFLGVQL